jgi:GNAT superfamily N-acetyltransferase
MAALTIQQIYTPDDLANFTWNEACPPVTSENLCRHSPDAHWIATNQGHLVARCSLWWTDVPQYPGETLGVIGHYAAADAQTGAALLDQVCAELRDQGCTLAVGPMDGNTWRRYRLISERGTEPTFFLEADNPDDYPKHFASFNELAHYTSAVTVDLSYIDPRVEKATARLAENGITIRPIDLSRFEAELNAIYEISVVSFQKNYLYTPISPEDFLNLYRPIQQYIRPELVCLALREDKPVGFVFAVPDLFEMKRQPTIETVILKTLAVLPGRTSAGLGTVLVARVHSEARRLGFKRVIHASMHESNNSKNISGHYAKIMRRYTLYSRSLR